MTCLVGMTDFNARAGRGTLSMRIGSWPPSANPSSRIVGLSSISMLEPTECAGEDAIANVKGGHVSVHMKKNPVAKSR